MSFSWVQPARRGADDWLTWLTVPPCPHPAPTRAPWVFLIGRARRFVFAAVPHRARPANDPVKASETASPIRRDLLVSTAVPHRAVAGATKARVARARAAIIIRSGNPLRAPAPIRGSPYAGPARRRGRGATHALRRRTDGRDREPAQGRLAGRLDPGRPGRRRWRVSHRRVRPAPCRCSWPTTSRIGLWLSHSGGGASDAGVVPAMGSMRWGGASARGPAAVILEPDALAADCLDPAAQRQRLALLRSAVDRLAAQPGIAVYIDAGNPTWVPAPEIARRLRRRGRRPGPRFRRQRLELLDAGQPRLRRRAVSRRAGGALLQSTHRPQRRRPRAGERLVQSLGPCAGRPADRGHRRSPGRRPAVGQASRRVGRHLQRRAHRRRVVGRLRAGSRPGGGLLNRFAHQSPAAARACR